MRMKRSREPEELPSPSSSAASDRLGSPSSDGARPTHTKIVELEQSETETASSSAMRCLLHQEALFFGTYDEYESHYSRSHSNKCLECKRNFPSDHLLAVHIEECHDAFAVVRREKGEHTYSCFVEGCERKCATPDKRRRHLIDKHMFPKNFFFAVTRDGIDGRQSLLDDGKYRHRRKSSARQNSIKETERQSRFADPPSTTREKSPSDSMGSPSKFNTCIAPNDRPEQSPKAVQDIDMDDLTGAMSALRFVPSSVRFGRGGKIGFSRR